MQEIQNRCFNWKGGGAAGREAAWGAPPGSPEKRGKQELGGGRLYFFGTS